MKKFILMVCATLLLNVFGSKASSSTSQLTSNNDINIIPKPASVEKQKGKFKLVKANSIYSNTSEGKIISELFASKLQASTGYDFNFTEKEKTGNISLIMNPKLMYKEDQYKLSVTPKGVSVLAKTPKGLFYGMQSFMQLLPPQVERQTAWKNCKERCQGIPQFHKKSYEGTYQTNGQYKKIDKEEGLSLLKGNVRFDDDLKDLQLPKLGFVKVAYSPKIMERLMKQKDAKIGTVTIRKTVTDEFFVSLQLA